MQLISKIMRKIRGIYTNEEMQLHLRNKGVCIGENCDIYPTAEFGSEPYLIKLGDFVRVNHHVKFITHDGGVWVLRHYLNMKNSKDIDLFGSITVENNVHIGTGATIMPGVSIGDNCIIGCDAVVTKNIPDNSIAVGVPAKVIESLDEYIEKHMNEFDITIRNKGYSEREKRNYLINKYL